MAGPPHPSSSISPHMEAADMGDVVMADGRKAKRELSQSKRAAQNRAAQVSPYSRHHYPPIQSYSRDNCIPGMWLVVLALCLLLLCLVLGNMRLFIAAANISGYLSGGDWGVCFARCIFRSRPAVLSALLLSRLHI
jgi:hypothetical protein